METIHIALPSDQNYIQGLVVTATSMAVYADHETELHFHVLDGGIRDDSFASFTETVTRNHARARFTRHQVQESSFDNFPAWSGNKMTYARLMLPEILKDVEHVIYCDTDVLWLAPIEELWRLRNSEVVACVCRDGCKRTVSRENDWFIGKGFSPPGNDYFCAAVMLLNLRLMRAEHVIEQVYAVLEQHRDIQSADQTALNYVLSGRIRLVDQRWHLLSIRVSDGPFAPPVVLHYGGEIPWKRKGRWELLTDSVMLWHWFNDRFVLCAQSASLKRYYTLRERIFKRALFLCLASAEFRRFFYWLLHAVNRGGLEGSFETYNRQIDRRSLRGLRQAWSRMA